MTRLGHTDPHRLAQEVEAARERLDYLLRQAGHYRSMATRYEDDADEAREALAALMAQAERMEVAP